MQMKKGFACFMMIDCQWAYFTQVEKRNRIKEVLGEGKKGGKEQIKKDNLFFYHPGCLLVLPCSTQSAM